MKILYLALIELEVPGGPTVHTLNLMKGFRNIDAKVRLLCPSPSKPVSDIDGFDCSFVPFFGYGPVRLFLFNILLVIKLFINHLTFRPEVVYLRDRPGNFFAILYLKLLRIPYFVEMNGFLEKDFPEEKGGIHCFLREYVFNGAKGLIFNCKDLASKYASQFTISEYKIAIVSMHVDTDHFKIIPRNECRKKLNIPEDLLLIGYVGGFSPRHDLEILKEIILSLEEDNIKAMLLIVGDTFDSDRKTSLLKGLKKDNIKITGWIPHRDIPLYINAMDVGTAFVKDSKGNDSSSFLKIKEYLACGVPVILNSETPAGFKEYPKNAVNVIASNSLKGIPVKTIVKNLIDLNNNQNDSIKTEIATDIKKRFNLSEAAKQTLVFFKTVLNKKGDRNE